MRDGDFWAQKFGGVGGGAIQSPRRKARATCNVRDRKKWNLNFPPRGGSLKRESHDLFARLSFLALAAPFSQYSLIFFSTNTSLALKLVKNSMFLQFLLECPFHSSKKKKKRGKSRNESEVK